MKPILLAILVSFAAAAAACPSDLSWEGLRSATTTYHDDEKRASGIVAIKIYSDGVYARTGEKEVYFLRDHDLVVFGGFPAEELKGPTPFFMIDMVAGIPAVLLAARFATPCAVPEREQQFEFTPSQDPLASKGPAPVIGRASRDGLSVTYEVRTDYRPQQGALIHASGVLDFSPRTAVPVEMSLEGWQVAVRDRKAGNEYRTLARAESVRTLGQLYEALPVR